MVGKTTVFAFLATFLSLSNAAVIDLFADGNCQTAAGTRNVYDNSCALTGGFQSFRIVSGGGGGQQISAYSRNACAGPVTACVSAGNVGQCYAAYDGNGGSNALSSSPVCGAV